ncbi:hypothetical protein AACH06_08505 [Ideonella sp. DXS29W]|uniref:Uncharacterized protein n=1 Tax=Ideonella lacteola TaxID=2984193 RepID=A0ABU9BLM4_9BURK
MHIHLDFGQRRWLVLGMVTAPLLIAGNVNATPILQPDGWAYVYEDFSNTSNSNNWWYYASCNQVAHGTTDGNAPNTQYKTFGQASRPGYCGPRTLDGNQFFRFITMPFDRRDAVVTYNADGSVASDNWNEMDDGKGGSEMRSRQTYYAYDGITNKRGWDDLGVNYLAPTNTVRFSWKFRLYNVSMLKRDANGDKLAASAVVGQFHSQNIPECNRNYTYEDGFSPAPGLDVRVDPGPDGSEHVYFKLFTKIRNSQVPSGVQKCSQADADANKICQVTLWEQSFPIANVTRVDSADTHVPPWISISYVMRPSVTNGALKFLFGVEGSSDQALNYQVRPLGSAGSNQSFLRMPMTQNDCPNRPFVGSYVLGYNRKYYGYLHGDAAHYVPKRTDQQPWPSVWVHPNLLGNAHLKSYIDGTWAPGDYPPQFIVDYDDFRIVQVPQLP